MVDDVLQNSSLQRAHTLDSLGALLRGFVRAVSASHEEIEAETIAISIVAPPRYMQYAMRQEERVKAKRVDGKRQMQSTTRDAR